jgi:hypothetical protein
LDLVPEPQERDQLGLTFLRAGIIAMKKTQSLQPCNGCDALDPFVVENAAGYCRECYASTNAPTCDCGSQLPYGEHGTQERFIHNTSDEHFLAVMRSVGAPQSVIDQAMLDRARFA